MASIYANANAILSFNLTVYGGGGPYPITYDLLAEDGSPIISEAVGVNNIVSEISPIP